MKIVSDSGVDLDTGIVVEQIMTLRENIDCENQEANRRKRKTKEYRPTIILIQISVSVPTEPDEGMTIDEKGNKYPLCPKQQNKICKKKRENHREMKFPSINIKIEKDWIVMRETIQTKNMKPKNCIN